MESFVGSVQRPPPAARWRSTTSRWLLMYTGMFALSVVLLVVFIGTVAQNSARQDADTIIDWQLIFFDSVQDAQLQAAIYDRLEHEKMHANFYGLFSPDGRYLAGDILKLPAGFAPDRSGVTFDETLNLRGADGPLIVRAMGERRMNGDVLIVARDMTHVIKIRRAIIRTLVASGLLILIAGVAGGVMLSINQMRRVRSIRRVITRIARGDLHQRLPVGGRDELDLLAHLVNHMLNEVERLMGEVKGACDGIAHDFRTPLSRVKTLLSRIAADDAIQGEARALDMIEQTALEIDRLLERFAAMLRISEIGSLQRRGGFATVDLRELILVLGDLYEPLAESKSVEFVVNAEPVVSIHGDGALLFEALSNLVDNAIKFAPENGRVSIALLASGAGPVIEIIDNGSGIPTEERGRVFERFYRGTYTAHTSGSGLGLSIVSAILRTHDFGLLMGDAYPGLHMTVQCWPQSIQ